MPKKPDASEAWIEFERPSKNEIVEFNPQTGERRSRNATADEKKEFDRRIAAFRQTDETGVARVVDERKADDQ